MDGPAVRDAEEDARVASSLGHPRAVEVAMVVLLGVELDDPAGVGIAGLDVVDDEGEAPELVRSLDRAPPAASAVEEVRGMAVAEEPTDVGGVWATRAPAVAREELLVVDELSLLRSLVEPLPLPRRSLTCPHRESSAGWSLDFAARGAPDELSPVLIADDSADALDVDGVGELLDTGVEELHADTAGLEAAATVDSGEAPSVDAGECVDEVAGVALVGLALLLAQADVEDPPEPPGVDAAATATPAALMVEASATAVAIPARPARRRRPAGCRGAGRAGKGTGDSVMVTSRAVAQAERGRAELGAHPRRRGPLRAT